MATPRFHWSLMLLTLGFALAAAGCQSATPEPSPQHAPRYDNGGYHRPRNPYFNPKPILALDSAELNRLEMEAGLTVADRPLTWFDYRNDVRASTVAGQYSPTREFIATYTHDRQYQHGNQIHDQYHQSTYRNSVRQTVR